MKTKNDNDLKHSLKELPKPKLDNYSKTKIYKNIQSLHSPFKKKDRMKSPFLIWGISAVAALILVMLYLPFFNYNDDHYIGNSQQISFGEDLTFENAIEQLPFKPNIIQKDLLPFKVDYTYAVIENDGDYGPSVLFVYKGNELNLSLRVEENTEFIPAFSEVELDNGLVISTPSDINQTLWVEDGLSYNLTIFPLKAMEEQELHHLIKEMIIDSRE
ncbi:hypothetical protein [Bacillus sp. JCM 19034]|uniref:hypothetical protein n=1 Tax=Bacillus sp. JCM 19034 TaxID=1481928 RepID=UPI0007802897|nr:hypothetical protein [Bacillus sp. JCM 19034]